MKTRRLLLLAALPLALSVAGCGMFSGSKAQAEAPIDPSAGALVVLYHVHLGVDEDDFTDHVVYLNGTKIGRLNAGEELRVPVGPGITELSVLPQLRWIGTSRQEPLKYSIETPRQGAAPKYLRYRTASGEARIAPTTGAVMADRELLPVSELEYSARN